MILLKNKLLFSVLIFEKKLNLESNRFFQETESFRTEITPDKLTDLLTARFDKNLTFESNLAVYFRGYFGYGL